MTRFPTARQFALLFAWACVAAPAAAEGELRWKLAPGERYRLAMTQETGSTVAYSSKTLKSSYRIEVDLLWTIDQAVTDPQPGWQTTQTVERIALQMTDPAGTTTKYDSAIDLKPLGATKEVAQQVAPLLGAKYTLTVDSRGQVLSAAAPAPAGAAPAGSAPPAGAPAGNAFSPETISLFLKQPLLPLPALAPAPGTEWSHTAELPGPLGTQRQVRKYQFAGREKLGTTDAAKITQTATLELVGSPAGKATLKQQESRGAAWFSPELGRLLQAEQTQTLATERPYRETKITVTLQSTLRTLLSPAQAASP